MKKNLHISSENIRISWDDEQLTNIIQSMFSPWHGEDCSPTYEVIIKRTKKGYILTTPIFSTTCQDDKTLSSNLEYALTLLSKKILTQHIQIHASCVDFNGNGALIVGSHGAGKTTLALTAISSGLKALTDDIAVISEDFQHVTGFPRPFRVTYNTWNMFPCLVPKDCPYLKLSNGFTYVFFYRPQGRYYVDKTRLMHIIFPVLRDGHTEIKEIGETETLRKILPQGFNFYMKKDAFVMDLLRLIRHATPFEIVYSDHWEAIRMISDMLA